MKGEEVAPHLQRIGEFMGRLLSELQPAYGEEPVYQVLVRVFGEHFRLAESQVVVKANRELSASSLQSPDDLEATYREKRGQGYQGYVANVTETCDPENDLQLITKVQVAPNNRDDSQLLAEALPNLGARTDLDTLYTDGGYGSSGNDQSLADQQIEHLQTAIRGRTPNPEKLHLADFDLQFDEDGRPAQITCPKEQTVSIGLSRQGKAFVAHFDPERCAACPLVASCPVALLKSDPRPRLHFTQVEARKAQRRRKSRARKRESGNLRAAVEATVRSVKHPYPHAQVPVRGRFRVACLMTGSAALINVRSIQRYLLDKLEAETGKKDAQSSQNADPNMSLDSFLAFARNIFRRFFLPEICSGALAGC
jgi:hypothetical protein